MANERKWTIMVYMAGDNDLSNRCVDDLRKMKLVGSREGVVDLLVQVDRSGEIPTKRYHVKSNDANGPLTNDEQQVEEKLDEDTGNAETLQKFVFWGIENYQAEHYMLVLWGHARGLDEFSIAGRIRRHNRRARRHRHGYKCGVAQGIEPEKKLDMPFFIICPDEGSGDALTNLELKEVLRSVKAKLNRKLDIFGMDACLMSIAEMCYELRDSVEFTIGSETLVPSVGWPYHRILQQLVEDPELSAEQLSGIIVQKFVEFYGDYDAENVQLSACNLTKHKALRKAVDKLARLLKDNIQTLSIDNAVLRSHWRAQSYDDDQFFDLYDFCQLLKEFCEHEDIKSACAEAMKLIDPKSFAFQQSQSDSGVTQAETVANGGFVVKSDFLGDALQFSHGLSIYFPWAEVSERYQHLDFARDTAWLDFLDVYVKRTQRLAREREAS